MGTGLTDIELFAGGGGMALGLERAGFMNVAAVEFNHAACDTLRRNRPGWNVVEGDVHSVDFTGYRGEVDLVSGGAPCQSFSYAGKRLGFGDVRGTLFAEFARCLREVQPKAFMFENVKGMLTHDKGRTFGTILHTFRESGYVVQYKLLDASLLGVAQRRIRLIVIGIRDDLAAAGASFVYPEPDTRRTTLREALVDVPDSPGARYSERFARFLELVPPGGNWRQVPVDMAREYMGRGLYGNGDSSSGFGRRMSWGEPCLTLLTTPADRLCCRCHPDMTRPFTVREYARIQSFPDDWVFCGSVGEQYRQIGNAVPVELARRVGVRIIEAISGLPANASQEA